MSVNFADDMAMDTGSTGAINAIPQDPFLDPASSETSLLEQVSGDEGVTATPSAMGPDALKKPHGTHSARKEAAVNEDDADFSSPWVHPIVKMLPVAPIRGSFSRGQSKNPRQGKPDPKPAKTGKTPSASKVYQSVNAMASQPNLRPMPGEPASLTAQTSAGVHSIYRQADYGGYADNRWDEVYGRINATS